jgi:dinuclear metal center YbgI/SA1388 family protein
MHTVETILAVLERLCPPRLAEEWDNTGLLVGDRRRGVARLMTCLTLTPPSVREAVQQRAELVVAHHPLPFRPVDRLTTDTTAGQMLLELAAARIAVYCPHTAFDSAPEGINRQLAAGLGLRGIAPLAPRPEGEGAGRFGWLEQPTTLDRLARRLMEFLGVERLGVVGLPDHEVRTVGVACGAADELLGAACRAGCDCLVLGEARFHTCLEAEAGGVALLLPGHFASERFAVERLAERLAAELPDLGVWASRIERDPLRWMSQP